MCWPDTRQPQIRAARLSCNGVAGSNLLPCPALPRCAALCCAVQGSAADISKAAMVALHRRAAEELPQGACQLLLQIHDELLLEVEEALVPQVCRNVL